MAFNSLYSIVDLCAAVSESASREVDQKRFLRAITCAA